ncbi:hypothetical protein [Dictyobacter kobayashii]|uniref:Uncharacterized protein n=1 Tax=Dictyobacter kobayashii TaxID=2014872 RepID=A0A402AU83_9CHLR|nr:hypothetical protein [Dictyobacter kobayashii]GCE22706.1 hypothetical protein KDK_65060 [Dictyobacter kobayashii]
MLNTDMLLILKLILTPFFTGVVSAVGRRWGSQVSGWLIGLPLTAGPISVFLALEHGSFFASHAAHGTLLGVVSLAAFCLAYSWSSWKFNWPISLLIGWLVFAIATFLLMPLQLPLLVSFIGVVCILLLTLVLFPREIASANASQTVSSSRWEILGRMVTATIFVLLLTASANLLGPVLSGLLAPFPLFATILAVFAHHFQDAGSARRVLHGLIFGAFAFATFFLVIAQYLPTWGLALTFTGAIVTALLVQGCSFWILKSYERKKRNLFRSVTIDRD